MRPCSSSPPLPLFLTLTHKSTDVTGPSSATSAILLVVDIFGYSAQALQGADILAHADGPSHNYRVFAPDFFLGNPLPLDVFPPDTDEKKKTIGDFFSGRGNPPDVANKVKEIVAEISGSEAGKGISKWGALGMCWGGKVISLASTEGTPFSAAAEVHPAMVDPEDAKKIAIPVAMLASGDEDEEAVKKFGEECKGGKRVEFFKDQVHGWMAARADLKDKRVKEEYERGYRTLLEFYHEYL